MRTKKPWGGRFSKATAASVENFSESISFDWRLYKYDIQGSIAHAKMLAKCGLISEEDRDAIIHGLKGIESEISDGKFNFTQGLEDIHMNIEVALIERIGDAGKKLHTARSRNDQIALDIRLWMRDEIVGIQKELRTTQRQLVDMGEKYINLILPGFTHLQHAQPISAAHYLLAYVEMFNRDYCRLADCLKRVNILPLGACALAGTGLPIDREYIAKELGFDDIAMNSLDAVSDRDFCTEFAFCLATIAMHLSRLTEEWVLWASQEFSFIEIDDSFCTGSSIMPQKKNPDVLELIRGKTGRVYGNLMALLSMMKGLPLAYNRDMQEDKEAIFDSADTVNACLKMIAELIPNVTFNESKIAAALEDGFLDSTALADYLVLKGMPFREAHEVVGKIVKVCIAKGVTLTNLKIGDFKAHSPLIDEDVYNSLGVENCLRHFKSLGSTGSEQTKLRLQYWKERVAE